MIKIEVTGNSIPEVADKLLAIGHSLYSKTVVPIANGGTGAQTLEELTGAKTLEELFTGAALFAAPVPVDSSVSVPEDISPAALEEVEVEVADEAPENPTSPSNIGATTVDGLSSQPTPKEPATTPAPAASAPEDEELEVVDLPIAPPAEEIDLRALVLKVVETRGKPFMEGILSSFGVVKASHVEPARLHELVARCQEALGK